MMRTFFSSACVVAMVVGGTAMLNAQSKKAAPAPTAYDRAMETTVGGVIAEVISAPGPDGSVGVHAIVKTDAGRVNIQIGPALFIGMNNFSFLTEDRVAVVGARVAQNGGTVIWVRSITKDGQTLVLRDESGAPKWAAADDDADGCGVVHDIIR
jgi:hypothetical protein